MCHATGKHKVRQIAYSKEIQNANSNRKIKIQVLNVLTQFHAKIIINYILLTTYNNVNEQC